MAMIDLSKTQRSAWLACAVASTAVVGCASSQAPSQLIDARAAYTHAQTGHTTQLDPTSLHEAKVSLDRAEHAYAEDGASGRVRDLAYIATRKAELADATGDTAYFQGQLQAAKAQQQRAEAKATANTNRALEATQQQLQRQKAAHESADQQAQQAQAAIDHLAATNAAKVKHDSRGTIITLPGTLLFASGQSTLLPVAQEKLGEVAVEINQQQSSHITIEGFTDSRGNDDANLALSRARAERVQDYLANHGVQSDRMAASGLGAAQPIADNATPAGRAD
ncbi:MAG TPA: OmpA family protein, partial [Polyangiales bacterium]|nr:OmpA family protein [Polyangiales bacterium]